MRVLILISVLLVAACSSKPLDYKKAENAFDAGREFIDAQLKGDFKKATFYMLPDETNIRFLKIDEADYRLKDKEGRQQLRTASINIQKVEDKDSVTSIIFYNNSFDKAPKEIKVIRQKDSWLVDYKYSFSKK